MLVCISSEKEILGKQGNQQYMNIPDSVCLSLFMFHCKCLSYCFLLILYILWQFNSVGKNAFWTVLFDIWRSCSLSDSNPDTAFCSYHAPFNLVVPYTLKNKMTLPCICYKKTFTNPVQDDMHWKFIWAMPRENLSLWGLLPGKT